MARQNFAIFFCISFVLALTSCAKSSTTHASNKDAGTGPTDASNGKLATGERCTVSSDCASNLCLGVGTEFLCSQPCGDCPKPTYCSHVDPHTAPDGETPPESGFYCLPDRQGLCKPCGSDINCTYPADKCLDLGGGEKACGRDCSYNQTCPMGYQCTQGQCHPKGDSCDCTNDRVGATQRCEISNTFGTCHGTETCTNTGWQDCDATEPGPEVCDGIDDDCDGVLPDDELDTDGNGIIQCQEHCQPKPEQCDLNDDDCNSVVDDGDPVAMCGSVDHGQPACVAGVCQIDQCDTGYRDLDETFDNGCECQIPPSGGSQCDEAEDLGSVDDTGQVLMVGTILAQGEEVWYKIQAIDLPQGPTSTCDTFHFRAQFVSNPDDSYLMDVFAGDCTQQAVCPQSMTDFSWYTNFRQGSGSSAIGECDCLDDPTQNGEGYNQCQDNGATYLIRIYKVPNGAINCQQFQLEISNGVYSP